MSPTAIKKQRVLRLSKFAAVGATGIVVNQLALWFAADIAGIYYVWGAVLATQVSSTWNFALTEVYVFKAQRPGRGKRLLWFTGLNNAWMVARLPLLWVLTEAAGMHYLLSNLVAIGAATLIRFFIADRYIWAAPSSPDQAVVAALSGRRYYDIHGLVGVASDAPLPELQAFEVEALGRPPEIDVEVGRLPFKRGVERVVVDGLGDRVSYTEQIMGWGFGVQIEFGSSVHVRACRLLGRSPHVLYTNVVEPLLRWEFVRKGYAMAHGAFLEIGGHGVLITAETDTGKTTTCLRAVRNEDAVFLSDDMVILAPDGNALSYPKPLTISAHTLKAANAAPLPLHRKALLQIQSRVHSKSGRRFAFALAGRNLPVATINAITQIIVPPPKYPIATLIPGARTLSQHRIDHIVVIERGPRLIEPLSSEEATRILVSNTEDAYGFPPYPFIAPILCREDAIEEAAMFRSLAEATNATRIRTPDRSWYEALPDVVGRTVEQGRAPAGPVILRETGDAVAS